MSPVVSGKKKVRHYLSSYSSWSFSRHHLKLERAIQYIQPASNKVKMKNGFWMAQVRGKDIREQKVNLKTSYCKH